MTRCFGRWGRWVILGGAILGAGAWAPIVGLGHEGEHDHPAPAKVPDEQAHRATPLPDRIILTWTGNPSNSQSVTWRTDATVARGVAQIAVAEPGPNFVKKAKEVVAETTPFNSDLGKVYYHSVAFADLVPKTKYLYRVGDSVNWSEWFQFETASDQPEPFSFIYFGDAQNDIKEHWSRVVREANRDAPKAKFLLHAGDLVTSSTKDALWGEWFQAGGWLNGMMPNVPTPGNHEYVRDPMTFRRVLCPHWRAQFALPTNGPEGLEETAYWFDYQGTRIVSLNSNERIEEQVAWLDQLLENNPNAWTVVTFHHPVYSSARGRDNPIIRARWQPIFDRRRVDLVLQGHDHTYARTGLEQAKNLPVGVTTRSPTAGTVYVVSVSGPKMYSLERVDRMRRAAEDAQLYQIISIDGPTLRYEARTATGDLYDAFTLKKRADQPNELIDEIPATPELLRPPPAPKAAEEAPKKAG